MKKKILKQYKEWLTLQGYSTFNYYFCIRQFLKITKVKPKEITDETVANFILQTKDRYNPSTINSHLKALKTFAKFLNLNLNLPPLRKERVTIPNSFSLKFLKEEIIPTINNCYENDILRLKYTTIVYFWFFTGLRKNEFLLLKRKYFDLSNKRVKIIDKKTNKERIELYPDNVKKLLSTYFSTEAENKNAFNLGINSLPRLLQTIKNSSEKCRKINLHPHLFRKSFATYLLKNRMSYKGVAKLGGWNNIKTLERYEDANIDNIQEAFNEIVEEKGG